MEDPRGLPRTYLAGAPALALPPLRDEVQADVAIVGGGITGSAAALFLAEAGATVVLVEGGEIGGGGSGRAFGQVVPYWKPGESAMLRRYGPDWGERMLAGAAAGPALVRRLIERHNIECEMSGAGLLFAAHAPGVEAGLDARATFWARRGAHVGLLRGAALEEETGTRFYQAALLDGRGFCVNPLAYTRGMARAAMRAGALLHEESRAMEVTREGAGWRVATTAGAVRSAQVVLATDAYTDGLWPGLRRSITPMRGYQIVSAPLGDNVRRTVLPGGQALTDTRRLYSGIRVRAGGRLHLSAYGPAARVGVANQAGATRRVRELYPQLPEVTWEEEVSGYVGMSADHVPHLHRLAPGVIAALGLSGRGIALGTVLGQEAAGRVLGQPAAEWVMPDTPVRNVGWIGKAMPWMIPAARVMDGWDMRSGR